MTFRHTPLNIPVLKYLREQHRRRDDRGERHGVERAGHERLFRVRDAPVLVVLRRHGAGQRQPALELRHSA